MTKVCIAARKRYRKKKRGSGSVVDPKTGRRTYIGRKATGWEKMKKLRAMGKRMAGKVPRKS